MYNIMMIVSLIIFFVVYNIKIGFEKDIKNMNDDEIMSFLMNLSPENKLKVMNLAMMKISALLSLIICFLIWL